MSFHQTLRRLSMGFMYNEDENPYNDKSQNSQGIKSRNTGQNSLTTSKQKLNALSDDKSDIDFTEQSKEIFDKMLNSKGKRTKGKLMSSSNLDRDQTDEDSLPKDRRYQRLELQSNSYMKLHMQKNGVHDGDRERATSIAKNLTYNSSTVRQNPYFNRQKQQIKFFDVSQKTLQQLSQISKEDAMRLKSDKKNRVLYTKDEGNENSPLRRVMRKSGGKSHFDRYFHSKDKLEKYHDDEENQNKSQNESHIQSTAFMTELDDYSDCATQAGGGGVGGGYSKWNNTPRQIKKSMKEIQEKALTEGRKRLQKRRMEFENFKPQITPKDEKHECLINVLKYMEEMESKRMRKKLLEKLDKNKNRIDHSINKSALLQDQRMKAIFQKYTFSYKGILPFVDYDTTDYSSSEIQRAFASQSPQPMIRKDTTQALHRDKKLLEKHYEKMNKTPEPKRRGVNTDLNSTSTHEQQQPTSQPNKQSKMPLINIKQIKGDSSSGAVPSANKSINITPVQPRRSSILQFLQPNKSSNLSVQASSGLLQSIPETNQYVITDDMPPQKVRNINDIVQSNCKKAKETFKNINNELNEFEDSLNTDISKYIKMRKFIDYYKKKQMQWRSNAEINQILGGHTEQNLLRKVGNDIGHTAKKLMDKNDQMNTQAGKFGMVGDEEQDDEDSDSQTDESLYIDSSISDHDIEFNDMVNVWRLDQMKELSQEDQRIDYYANQARLRK